MKAVHELVSFWGVASKGLHHFWLLGFLYQLCYQTKALPGRKEGLQQFPQQALSLSGTERHKAWLEGLTLLLTLRGCCSVWARIEFIISHAETISPDPSQNISEHGFTRKSRKPFCLSVPFSMYRKAQGGDTESEEALQDFRFPGNSRKRGGGLHSGVRLVSIHQAELLATWQVTEFKESRQRKWFGQYYWKYFFMWFILTYKGYTLVIHADKQKRTLFYNHGTESQGNC